MEQETGESDEIEGGMAHERSGRGWRGVGEWKKKRVDGPVKEEIDEKK